MLASAVSASARQIVTLGSSPRCSTTTNSGFPVGPVRLMIVTGAGRGADDHTLRLPQTLTAVSRPRTPRRPLTWGACRPGRVGAP